MPGKAAKVVITERQQEILQALIWSRSCPQGLAHRAEIILLAFEGLKNEQIAARLNCERHGVGTWRRRWQKAFEQLVIIECTEKPSALREAIAEVLSDLPRAGCGGTFTAEQITQILATACEAPEGSGRPVSHWTPRELADEVIQRGIVPSISVRHVGRFLKDGGTSAAQEPLLAQRQPRRPGRVRRAGSRGVCDLPGGPGTAGEGEHPHGVGRREAGHSGVGTEAADQADEAGRAGASRV